MTSLPPVPEPPVDHKHFFAPKERCLIPFAAKHGWTEEDLVADMQLQDRMMNLYAESYGHDPAGNWILIVHPDDATEFYRFEEPKAMWCCSCKAEIRHALAEEVAAFTGGLQDAHT